MTNQPTEVYDVIIIGAGFAGLTAAIYTARGGQSTLILDHTGFGGQIINSDNVENYPGIANIKGFDLAKNLCEQVKSLNANITSEEATGIKKDGGIFTIETPEHTFKSRTIILASGSTPRSLNLNNEHYCATCDGAFFKGKIVAVVGGGNTAFQDAIYLANLAEKVHLVNRREEFRADQILVDRAKNTKNIEIHINPDVRSEVESLNPDGVFVAIGHIPNTAIVKDFADLDQSGQVISPDTTTKTPGLFVAGDCRNGSLKQLVTAAADGALAAQKSIEYNNAIT